MADVVEVGPLTDATAAIALGKRHLLVRDYNSAVNTLIQACELLVQKYGERADELAEPYLLYGRALLNLAREESNVLGTAVPCEKDSDDEVEGEDDEEGEEDEKDEKDEKSETVKTEETSATSSAEKKEGVNSEDLKTDNETDESEPKLEEKPEVEIKPTESKIGDKAGENNVTADSKSEDKRKEDKNKVSMDEATPESSKIINEESSTSLQNGDIKENGEDDEEMNDEEDVDNLEVAWEVLEVAKLVLLKRGPSGWQLLSEAHKLLGEVAMEGGNASGALTDFHACLELLQKIEPCNPRAIAEIYYQLGLAYSFANDFDSSIQQFKEAASLLEARIKELEDTSEPLKSEDPFYTVEGEIKELKELLPQIDEKISDMKDAKQEACRLIIEGIREKASAGSCSNGASTSKSNNGASSSGETSGSSSGASSSKPVSDISHLIRKKRKPQVNQVEEASPCKKLSPQ